MGTGTAFGVHQHSHGAFQYPEGDQTLLTVSLSDVFTRDREVVPNGLAPYEIEPVILDVLTTFGFVPGGHEQSVVTKYGLRKGNSRNV